MGHCKKILSSNTVEAVPKFLSNQGVLELAENFHFHYRNYRLEMDHSEFETLSLAFIEAYAKWNLGGRKHSVRYKYAGDKNIVLSKFNLNSHPSIHNPETSVNSIRTEIQKNADHIHIHYKDFRFELTLSEFEDFSRLMEEGRNDLKNVLAEKPSPNRIGLFHRTVPFGRVDDKTNTNFWQYPDDCDYENLYESTYANDGDDKLILTRETDDNSMYKIHINDLYASTLYYKGIRSPWGIDETGVFIPLINRYKFVQFYVTNNRSLTKEQVELTDYYKLLRNPLNSSPRDGETNKTYADAHSQCRRFMSLIDSMFVDGYGNKSTKNSEMSEDVLLTDAGGEISTQINNKQIKDGVISFYMECSLPQVHNGLHRLSVLKYLYDNGLLDNPLVLVQHHNCKPYQIDHRPISLDKNGFPIGSLRLRDHTLGQIYKKMHINLIGLFSFISTSLIIIFEKLVRLVTFRS
ncbi:hypothetical protein N9Z34_03880 [Gammaproteobacteria bacterium]|nr:hypothetical protein [Gammaproteobacteria bacterium]